MQRLDLTAKRFGRLVVQWPVGRGNNGARNSSRKFPQIHWLCLCDCGELSIVSVANLTGGNTNSCGCYSDEVRKTCNLKHGKCRTPEYIMWQMAKHRATRDGLPFDLEISDVVIPPFCPMLGIRLFQANGVLHDNSPSLDRRDGAKGYVKGNVRVVSYKANRAKGNLTLEEMKLLVSNWEKDLATQ